MKKHFLSHMITVISVAISVFFIVLLLAQNNKTNEATQKLSEEIKAQTDINQRYLRCILLIERDKFASVETRVAAIDKCAVESRTPDGRPSGLQPTIKQQKDYEKNL
jgi:low affinity Fe/Cu permease